MSSLNLKEILTLFYSEDGILSGYPKHSTEINEVPIQKCGVCKDKVKENRIFGFEKCDHILVLCERCSNQLPFCPFRCQNSNRKRLILRELA